MKRRLAMSAPPTIDIQVELFGSASIASGRRRLRVSLPARPTVRDVASALALECPELVDEVVSEDGSGLRSSYTLNVNGTRFVDSGPLDLAEGDSLLLFSSQAGG